ncbi:MAG: hypothetical protein ACLTCQ_07215 [Enterocloster bolteae]
MKDKRIWIVIGCILFIGTGVTHYTKYYVNSQGAAMMAEITAGAEDTAAAPSFAPALGQQDTEAGGTDTGMAAAGRAAPATPAERRMTGDAGPGNTASGNTASGDAGLASAGPEAQLWEVQIPEMRHTQRLLQQRQQQSPFRPARQLLQWRMPLGKQWLRILRVAPVKGPLLRKRICLFPLSQDPGPGNIR